LELTTAKLAADKAKLDAELDVMRDKKIIAESLASPDMNVRRSILTNPELSDALFSDTDYANKVLGNLFSTTPLTKEEQDSAFARFNLINSSLLQKLNR